MKNFKVIRSGAFRSFSDRCPVGTRIQTLIFDKKYFTAAMARRWIKAHGFKASKVDETENSYRYRQRSPSSFDAESFRTITLGNSFVKAVIACPK